MQPGHFPLETGRAIRNTRLWQVEGSVETPDVRYESGVLAPKRPWGDFLLSVAIKLRIDTRQYSTLLLVPGVPDQLSKSTRPEVQHMPSRATLKKANLGQDRRTCSAIIRFMPLHRPFSFHLHSWSSRWCVRQYIRLLYTHCPW